MNILVLSDSHGNLDNMVRAVEREAPDRIFHLGDGWREAGRLHDRFPALPFWQVRGNCDCAAPVPAERLVVLEGLRILLCHGHTYHVKSSLLTAGYAAEERELDAFLFSLGCYSGEPITVISHRKGGCVISIKDGRYTIDRDLASAIEVQ